MNLRRLPPMSELIKAELNAARDVLDYPGAIHVSKGLLETIRERDAIIPDEPASKRVDTPPTPN